MTIPRLQGWWDEIQPYAKDLTEIIENKFYPNRRLQKAMQVEISKNPQLLQQFADLRARDPNILKKIGLDNIDMMIGGLPESAASVAEGKKTTILKSPTTSQEEIEIRAGVLGTQTPKQREKEEADIEGTLARTTATEWDTLVRKVLFPSEQKKAEAEGVSAEQTTDLLRKYPTGVIARQKLAGKYENINQLTPEEIDVLSTHPTFKANFERIRDDYWNRERLDFQERFARRDRSANYEAAAMWRWAEQVADYGGADPRAVMQFTTLTPDEQKRIKDSTTPANAQEEPLWKAARGIKTLADKHEVSLQRNIIDIFYKDPTFNTSMKTLQRKGATANDKIAAISVINGVMAAKGREMGMPNPPQWELKETSIGWLRKRLEPTLVSGDLGLSEAIAREGGITVNTPGDALKKAEEDKVLSDDQALDARAEALAKDLKEAKTEAERTSILNSAAQMLGVSVYAEVRKRLPKYGVR